MNKSDYSVADFYKKEKGSKVRYIKKYLSNQWFDIIMSCFFILLSTSIPVFSFLNGAIWVLAWYLFTVLIAVAIYISQANYSVAEKRARKYAKKHPSSKVRGFFHYDKEIGGWNFLAAQGISAPVFGVMLGIFSWVTQTKDLNYYAAHYKSFCIGLFADTFIVFFFNVYFSLFKSCIYQRGELRQKIYAIMSMFSTNKFMSILIHIICIVVIFFAFKHYCTAEFSGLFNSWGRVIVGILYICSMTIDIKGLLKFEKEQKSFSK